MTISPATRVSSLSPEKRKLFSYLLEKEGVTAVVAAPIPRRNGSESLPLSYAQNRLWFIHQLEPQSAAYNISAAVKIRGRLEVTVLERSIQEIIRRHEILRTTFPAVNGRPTQHISPPDTQTLPVIDLRHLPAAERENKALALAKAKVQKPFDLCHGPLMRVFLFHMEEATYHFLLVMHHIICDGWSIQRLVGEMVTLYDAFSKGRASPLSPLPIQYADFALWQQTQLKDELARQLDYWQRQLDGLPDILALPLDRPRPPIQSFRGASQTFALSPALSRALVALSKQEGVTLYTTLLAAFQTLLYRYTGQHDVVVSTGIANRHRRETEPLIGCLINILLMRSDLSGKPAFRQLLQGVKQTVLDAHEHQDLPFEKLVETLRPQRDLSYSPLSQVMFVLHNTPTATVNLADLELEPLAVETTAAQYDLLLHMEETHGVLSGRLEYSSDLFDEQTIQRWLAHFQTLLQGIIINPDEPITTLPLLTDSEFTETVVAWNDTAIDFASDKCLHQLFESQVESQPQATAVYHATGSLTYEELNNRANQVAHYLRALGVRPDVRVGLCVERSVDMIIGLMGILKAGGAYVPLDPHYPKERLAFLIEDSQTKILLCQQHILERLPAEVPPVVCLDRDWQIIAQEHEYNPCCITTPENLVYLIYTSGSTGKPKGVMLNHQGRVNNFSDLNRRFRIGPGDRLLALSSLSFDMCAYDVFGILSAGATIVLPPAGSERDPSAWLEMLRQGWVTIWHSVPALLEMLMMTINDRPERVPHSLRLVLLGGDWIPISLPDRLKEMIPKVKVVSLGGATEASMDSIIYPITTSDPNWNSIPYGRPMYNQKAYILDAYQQIVPIGVPGEICLGGNGVAWGYFNRPQLTAEKFIPNPFGTEKKGERLYKTGDLARYAADGTIELLGRLDHQVKIRGFRVELGEIVAVLRQVPLVQEAVVMAKADTAGEKSLVAYLVAASGMAPDNAALRDALKKKLPEYMIPAAFVWLETIPLTPNGKVDRQALPAPESTDRQTAVGKTATRFVPPRTPQEQEIALAWESLLGIEAIGIDDDFFTLGGNSFKAVQVVQQLGNGITVVDLFQNPTIRQLAACLSAHKQTNNLHQLTPPTDAANLSLVCIPYGGGNAIIYQPLAGALPESIALYALALPGHDPNRQDEPLQSIEATVDLAVTAIKQEIRGPVALYGHCAGAALTIALARRLETAGYELTAVCLGGTLPGKPSSPVQKGLAQLKLWFQLRSSGKLLAYLNTLGGFDEVASTNGEFNFIGRSFRHDTQCAIAYFQQAFEEPRLKAPILCLVGDQDPLTDNYQTRFKEWEAFSDQVNLAVIEEGNHYFVKHQAEEVAGHIVSFLHRTHMSASS